MSGRSMWRIRMKKRKRLTEKTQLQRRLAALMMACVLALGLPGCSRDQTGQSGETRIYCLDEEGTGLEFEEYSVKATATMKQIDEVIALLMKGPDNDKMMKLLPETVEIDRSVYENGNLTLDFTREYLSMEKSREVLARAGIVRTLVQLPDVTTVSFTVADQPALRSDGSEIGPMDAECFVENAGRQINTYQHADINLYFATPDGMNLVRESRAIYYSSNRSIEWAIVARLIDGPKGANGSASIPSGTQIISISTVDGTCFVNLSVAFNTELMGVTPEVTIYSIVNSLIMSSNVTQVQFSIAGETDVTYRESIDLSKPFTENMSLVQE